jgi:hypothetical protein
MAKVTKMAREVAVVSLLWDQRHSSRRSEGAGLLKFKVFLFLISSSEEYATNASGWTCDGTKIFWFLFVNCIYLLPTCQPPTCFLVFYAK